MTDPIQQHEAALVHAFARVVQAERAEFELQGQLKAAENRLKPLVNAAAKTLADAWADVECLIADTGETEVTVRYDAGLVARIHYTTPGVKCVADADACPDKYVKVERKALLNDIKRDFLEIWKAGAPVPNWISFQEGEAKLTWKPTKDKGATP